MAIRHWAGCALAMGLAAIVNGVLTWGDQFDSAAGSITEHHRLLTAGTSASVHGRASGERTETVRSPFVARAFQTRVGLHRVDLDERQMSQVCYRGKSARRAVALSAAERLDRDGVEVLPGGQTIARNVRIILHCA